MAVTFKQHELANGLNIVGEINDEAHTGAVGFFTKVGTRDETAEIMGVSHFLEHMMFKGTDRRTADEVNRDFDRIGANYNAFTSQEQTAYYAHVLPEYIPQAIDILSDILRPTLRGEDFDMEKNVILEEIGMYSDRPFWVAYEMAMEKFFGPHTLGYRVLGTNDTIKQLKRDAMAEYFTHRYSPDNMVAAISGRVDFDEAVKQIEASCGHWPRTGVQRAYHDATPGQQELNHTDAKLTNHYVVAVMPGPSRQSDDRYAAAVLSNVLGDSDGSRLYWRLIDTGIADEAELAHQGFDQTGTFMAYASCPAARGEEVEAALFDVIDREANELTEGEVERARNKIAMDLTLQNERPAGRMMVIGSQWQYLHAYTPLADEVERIMAVDLDEIKAMLGRYDLTQRAVVRARPGKS